MDPARTSTLQRATSRCATDGGLRLLRPSKITVCGGVTKYVIMSRQNNLKLKHILNLILIRNQHVRCVQR